MTHFQYSTLFPIYSNFKAWLKEQSLIKIPLKTESQTRFFMDTLSHRGLSEHFLVLNLYDGKNV